MGSLKYHNRELSEVNGIKQRKAEADLHRKVANSLLLVENQEIKAECQILS